ncbi:MAG: ABC transporter ATP-binding protein [Blautia sp.]|jgi:ABC-2 type transport system ATP-binding protein
MISAISLRNVTKSYGDFKLDHINLEVPAGSIVGLVGENGAGKTTMIRSILQMVHLDEGEIFYNGERKTWEDYGWKDEISVVLTGLAAYAQMNAIQLGKCMANIYSQWDMGQYHSYLKRFRIDEKKKILKYSQGTSMKLNLAVALSHHAKFLILDEATSGLDPVVRDEILEILLDFIQEEDHTVFMSTHIVSDLERVADYIAFLHEGRLEFFESKDDLLCRYGILRCTRAQYEAVDPKYVASVRKNQFEYEVLVQDRYHMAAQYPDFMVDGASIEEIMVFLIKGEKV